MSKFQCKQCNAFPFETGGELKEHERDEHPSAFIKEFRERHDAKREAGEQEWADRQMTRAANADDKTWREGRRAGRQEADDRVRRLREQNQQLRQARPTRQARRSTPTKSTWVGLLRMAAKGSRGSQPSFKSTASSVQRLRRRGR